MSDMAMSDRYGVIPDNAGDPSRRGSAVIPRFKLVPVLHADGSYKDVEYLTIAMAGDLKSEPCLKVTDSHRRMYAAEYARFKQGLSARPEGFPIEEYGKLTQHLSPGQVMMLKAVNVLTAEQLAELPDINLKNLGPLGLEMRERAKKFIFERERSAGASQYMRELHSRDERIADLEAKLTRLIEAQDAKDTDPPKRGPGRPPKQAEAA